MRRDAHRALRTYLRQKFFTSFVVRRRHRSPISRDELDFARTMSSLSRRFPIGRISAAQPEHHVLRRRQRNVVRKEFERQNGDIDLEKEIKIDMRNTEIERFGIAREVNADGRDVGSPKDIDRALRANGPGNFAATAAIQKALHRRQKGHEFIIVPLLEAQRIAGEFILDFAPRIVRAESGKYGSVVLAPAIRICRRQLDRPQQNLSEMANALFFRCA